MGSLMAVWDSPVQDPKLAEVLRNRSLTKQEIEEYWKSQKKTEDEPLEATSSSPEVWKRTSSLPVADTNEGHLFIGNKEVEVNLEKLMNTSDWWTRSNWAFLNEPPVIAEMPKNNYVSQYHVASLASATKPIPESPVYE